MLGFRRQRIPQTRWLTPKTCDRISGEVITESGQAISEVFIVDLPNDPTKLVPLPSKACYYSARPTTRNLPAPPHFYSRSKTPRYFRPSSGTGLRLPHGSQIAFLMQDCKGIRNCAPSPPMVANLNKSPKSLPIGLPPSLGAPTVNQLLTSWMEASSLQM